MELDALAVGQADRSCAGIRRHEQCRQHGVESAQRFEQFPQVLSLGVASGCADSDKEGVGRLSQALTTPPTLASGVSTIENRITYGDPDKGEFVIPLTLNFCLPGEFCIQEQSQIDGSAVVRIVYDRSANTVDVYADFEGPPYRPTYEKDFDDSTEFNPQFMKVENAHWQLWLMGTVFGRYHETVYYDATTLKFLGTRFDFEPHGDRPFPEEGTYFTAPVPGIRMVCSPLQKENLGVDGIRGVAKRGQGDASSRGRSNGGRPSVADSRASAGGALRLESADGDARTVLRGALRNRARSEQSVLPPGVHAGWPALRFGPAGRVPGCDRPE